MSEVDGPPALSPSDRPTSECKAADAATAAALRQIFERNHAETGVFTDDDGALFVHLDTLEVVLVADAACSPDQTQSLLNDAISTIFEKNHRPVTGAKL